MRECTNQDERLEKHKKLLMGMVLGMRLSYLLSLVVTLASLSGVYFFLPMLFQKKQTQSSIPSTQRPAFPIDTKIGGTGPAIIAKDITLRERDKDKNYEFIVTAQESRFYPSDIVDCHKVICNIMYHGNG